jgi:hypothetical protein
MTLLGTSTLLGPDLLLGASPVAPPTNWPPVISGPFAAPLVLISGPKNAPLVLVSPPVKAPLVLVSGPRSTAGSGASELPMMSRRGLSRRSLPAEANEFVIEQFRALRQRRHAAKSRGISGSARKCESDPG